MKFRLLLMLSAGCSLVLGCGPQSGPALPPGARTAEQTAALLEEIAAHPRHWAERCHDGQDARACTLLGMYLDENNDDGSDTATIESCWQKGCLLGAGEACGRLGELQLDIQERSAYPDADQVNSAVNLLSQGCSSSPQRSGWACAALGDYHAGEYDLGQTVSHARAANLYSQGCKLGDASACGAAADLLLEQTAGQREILDAYQRGCDLGDLHSCESLGWIYMGSSPLPVRQDLGQAQHFYSRACEGGNGHSCTSLGLVYAAQGRDTRTREAYTRACEADDSAGCSYLAEIHDAVQDYALARELYAKSCELGDHLACDAAARLFMQVDEPDRAAHFRVLACQAGHAPLCSELGRQHFSDGQIELAREAYFQACQEGESSGCNWLGFIYATLEHDAPRALEAFTASCAEDDAFGCSWLGHVYFRFDRDVERASQAFERACALGDEWGCAQARRLDRPR